MELSITERSGDGFTALAVSHKGVQLVWNARVFNKVRLINSNEVFGGINQYLAILPEQTQDDIFECYRDIKECLDEMLDPGSMAQPIKQAVERLYHMIPMAHLQHWMMTQYHIYLPGDVQDTVQEGDRYPDRDETYIKEDYFNLATFSLALRLILPVWGEYIVQGGSGNGGDLYKEMDAMSLLSNTELMHWPPTNDHTTSVHEKLLRYIEIKVDKVEIALANLWSGIGSTEIPIRLLAMVMVRRLTIVPLSDHQAAHNIVANVHHYVGNKLKPNERRGGRVAPKRREGEGRDEDDKTSMLEEYKVKQQVPDGDVVAFEVDTMRMAIIAQKVDPSIDLRLLDKTTAHLNDLTKVIANDHQVMLAQYALAKAYPTRAFYDIDDKSVNRLLVTAQALYWHWGFFDIACMMTVERINLSEQNVPGLTTSVRPTSRFPKQTQDTFMELYPHFFPQSGKDANDRKGNVALTGIATVVHELFSASWHYHGPSELHRLANQPEGTRLLVVSTTIKQSLSSAVEKIVTLNQ